jgi:hypothetical protein
MKPKQPHGRDDARQMRSLGLERLVAYCLNPACRHVGLIDVSKFPELLQGRVRQMRRVPTH